MKIIRNPSAGGDPEKYRSTEPDAIFAPDIFVDDVNGLDTNDGLTALTAFKTLNKARTLAAAAAGSSFIYVFKGTYNENIIMSTLGFSDVFDMTWYLETGVFLNVTSRITTDSGTHFFDWIILSIRGLGIIRGAGNDLIDTTDSFFSTMSIECFNFTYIATAINPKPVKLGSQSDDGLDITLLDVAGQDGQFGFGSSVNIDNNDYFISCEDTSFTRIEDNVIIRGGQFATRQAGAIFASSDVPKVTMTWYTKGLQNLTNETNGIHIESAVFILKADSQGAQLGNLNVRAKGTGANDIRIADMNDPLSVWSSDVEVLGGICIIERCNWYSEARFIWVDNGTLIILDCDMRGTTDRMVSTSGAASILKIRDSYAKSVNGVPLWLSNLVKNDITNSIFIGQGIATHSIGSFELGSVNASMSNVIGNKGLSLVNDPLVGYTSNPLFDSIY